MEPIAKRLVVDEQNRPVAVQLDLATYERIEAVLEDYALYQLMQEPDDEEPLSLEAARAYYDALPKGE
ncbi:MAG TPA: hypothetical protein VK002_04115 [Rubricoccaceae bacterium]|jgi:PHD/YefM family antitoxin component YafN of YafNO toxin-antitoxin module|nr:hypothetical protein [Rubricoccaceae bacterium]